MVVLGVFTYGASSVPKRPSYKLVLKVSLTFLLLSSPICPDRVEKGESTIGQYLTINKLSKQELGWYRLIATRTDHSEYKGLNDSQILYVKGKCRDANFQILI